LWERDVFDEMDRMFEEPFFGRRGDGQQNWGLPLDVSEREDGYVVRASIPGIDPEELDISISDNVLTIRGEMKHEADQQNERYVLRERRMGSFTRSVSFPMAIDSDRAEAGCDNGVLTLRLPKAETARPRRIGIGGRSGRQTIEGQSTSQASTGGTAANVNVAGSGSMATPTGAVGSTGWPEGQAQTDIPQTERNREGQNWTEGQSTTNREDRAPQSGGWTEGQSETWDEKTPHSAGWVEGQQGQ
jgi:HSP20 family protein